MARSTYTRQGTEAQEKTEGRSPSETSPGRDSWLRAQSQNVWPPLVRTLPLALMLTAPKRGKGPLPLYVMTCILPKYPISTKSGPISLFELEVEVCFFWLPPV